MDRFPVHLHAAGIRTQLPADELEQGGLPGAARPHDGRDPATGDVQVHPVEDGAALAGETEVTDADQGRGFPVLGVGSVHVLDRSASGRGLGPWKGPNCALRRGGGSRILAERGHHLS